MTIKVVCGARRYADDVEVQELEGPDLITTLEQTRRAGSGKKSCVHERANQVRISAGLQ